MIFPSPARMVLLSGAALVAEEVGAVVPAAAGVVRPAIVLRLQLEVVRSGLVLRHLVQQGFGRPATA
jgi:hypothetical protein